MQNQAALATKCICVTISDIRRGAHIAMPEPFLDLLHGDSLCEEHQGAGVAKIVEAYFLQVMLLQQLSEVSGDEVGIVQLAECIHTDVVGVFLGVRRAHHLFHLLLLLAVTEQFASDEWLERQRAIGGLCFQSVLGDDTLLGGVYGVADGQRVLCEIDGRPLQPDHLAPSESVVSGKENRNIDLVILDQLEQLLHLLGVVVGGDELLLPRSVGLVNGVARYDPSLHRILERFMEHAVICKILQICSAESFSSFFALFVMAHPFPLLPLPCGLVVGGGGEVIDKVGFADQPLASVGICDELKPGALGEKEWMPSQEEFYIYSHSSVVR